MEQSSKPVGDEASWRIANLAAVIVFVGFLGTTLAQPGVLARIPLQNLIKNTLHLSRSANAAFFFWVGFPWYIKPLMGVLTDAFPLFGTRRKSYLMLAGVVATAAWLSLAFLPHDYATLLVDCVVMNLAVVLASTAVGGYMVEIAPASGTSGRLTALRNAAYQASWIVAGLAGGYLGGLAIGWTGVACAAMISFTIPMAWMMREPKRQVARGAYLGAVGDQLKALVQGRYLWAIAGLAALFYIAPGLSTALFYLQQNEMHLDTVHQGYIGLVSGGAGVLAAALYALFIARRVRLRVMLFGVLFIATGTALLYLFYHSYAAALLIDGVGGFMGSLCEIVLIQVAVRATPVGSEALGFALFMASRNLFLFGSDWLGAALIDRLHMSLAELVWLNSGTTFLAALLSLLLPAALVNVRDAEAGAH